MKRNKDIGFTLLELIILMAIIVGVILLIIPVLRGIRERGQMVNCANNLRELGIAALVYADEHKGIIPDIAPSPGSSTPSLANSDYIKDEGVYLCPRDRRLEGEFGDFKTSYTAFKYTPISIYTKEARADRVMFIESDLAGVLSRSAIQNLATHCSFRHSDFTLIAFADGHINRYYKEHLPGEVVPPEETPDETTPGEDSGGDGGGGEDSGEDGDEETSPKPKINAVYPMPPTGASKDLDPSKGGSDAILDTNSVIIEGENFGNFDPNSSRMELIGPDGEIIPIDVHRWGDGYISASLPEGVDIESGEYEFRVSTSDGDESDPFSKDIDIPKPDKDTGYGGG